MFSIDTSNLALTLHPWFSSHTAQRAIQPYTVLYTLNPAPNILKPRIVHRYCTLHSAHIPHTYCNTPRPMRKNSLLNTTPHIPHPTPKIPHTTHDTYHTKHPASLNLHATPNAKNPNAPHCTPPHLTTWIPNPTRTILYRRMPSSGIVCLNAEGTV